MKRGIKCIILICMIAIIGGCSSNNKKNNANSDLEKQSKINIEDIDWKVRQGIVDGNRYALLDYTNNTPYMITHFELTFEEKDDLKEEDKEKFYKHIKDVVNADDEGMEEIKNKKMQKAFNQNHIELLFLDNKQELLNYLDSTDFFEAPASTRYHLCEDGGLVQHSLNVYENLVKVIEFLKTFDSNIEVNEESIVLTALFHDLCKANKYEKGTYRTIEKISNGT